MSALLPTLKVVDTIKNPDEIILTKTLAKDRLKIWGNNMVNKAKDFLTSQLAIPVLLASLLGYNIYTNQQANARIAAYELKESANHDLLIELRTEKNSDKEVAARDRHEIMVKLEEAETWRKVLENKILEIKYQRNNN